MKESLWDKGMSLSVHVSPHPLCRALWSSEPVFSETWTDGRVFQANTNWVVRHMESL